MEATEKIKDNVREALIELADGFDKLASDIEDKALSEGPITEEDIRRWIDRYRELVGEANRLKRLGIDFRTGIEMSLAEEVGMMHGAWGRARRLIFEVLIARAVAKGVCGNGKEL